MDKLASGGDFYLGDIFRMHGKVQAPGCNNRLAAHAETKGVPASKVNQKHPAVLRTVEITKRIIEITVLFIRGEGGPVSQ